MCVYCKYKYIHMKHVLLLVLSLLLLATADAQNWAPLNLTDKYNYQLDSSDVITHTLWVDSFSVVAGDTLLFTNRVVENIDNAPFYNRALDNQPQFLGHTIDKHADGTYTLRNTNTMYLDVHVLLDSTYLFDTLANVTAQLKLADTTTLFGSVDSIKVLELSTGDTVILSKEHGVVHFPDGYAADKHYRLVGIEGGRTLGEQYPGFDVFFNYSIGDTFWYYFDFPRRYDDYGYQVAGTRVIDTMYQSGDTIWYHNTGDLYELGVLPGSSRQRSYVFGLSYLIDEPDNDINDHPGEKSPFIWIYDDTLGNDENLYQYTYDVPWRWSLNGYNILDPFGYYNDCAEVPPRYIREFGHELYRNDLGLQVKNYSDWYCRLDTFSDTLITGASYDSRRVFIEGLGMTELISEGFESYRSVTMYAYRKAGDTARTILDEDLAIRALGVTDVQAGESELHVLGNPFTDKLQIQLGTRGSYQLAVYSISGQLIHQIDGTDQQVSMDTHAWEKGIYFIELRSGKHEQRTKVIKM